MCNKESSHVIFLPGKAVLAFALLTGPIGAQVTTRVSVAPDGTQGNNDSYVYGSTPISADGRFVAFTSHASNLVAGDTNGTWDVFVRDCQTGTTERVSIATSGAEANGASESPSISADGRFVAFRSEASNLVPGDANGFWDVFVRDRQAGTTERVSVASGGAEANLTSFGPWISAEGRFVAFGSSASNLIPGDTNGASDIFVHDRQTGTTEHVSVATDGSHANDGCSSPSLSAEGRFVSFGSVAYNLVSGDTNGAGDVFVHDRQTGTTERVSTATGGAQANAASGSTSISADGRFVAFRSEASNLVPGDANGASDVFVHDRQTGTTERVSVATGGAEANFGGGSPSISADGRFVAFTSSASNLVPGDTNGTWDVFLHDRQTGTTERVSVATGGAQANNASENPSVSGDGRFVAFDSTAHNLVPGDTGFRDVFLRDRGAPFTTLCAGDGSGSPCACGNEAAPGSGGGCANLTPMPAGQGARLSASGLASVAADDLVVTVDFTTNQPGLFFQGHNAVNGGAGQTFGDGLRCCGGSVVRLEIADPPGPAGAHTVSSTLPILGTSPPGTTLPGDSRCYQWWYRNPGVSPCGSNFNLSNALLVTWGP